MSLTSPAFLSWTNGYAMRTDDKRSFGAERPEDDGTTPRSLTGDIASMLASGLSLIIH